MPAAISPEAKPVEASQPPVERGPVEGRFQTARAKFHTIANRFGTALAILRRDNPTIRLDQETEDWQAQTGDLDRLGEVASQELGVPEVFQKAFLDEEKQEQEATAHPNLPKIDEFPEKIRPEARAYFEKAKIAMDKAKALIKEGSIGKGATELNKMWWEGGLPSIQSSYSSQELATLLDDFSISIAEAGVNFPEHTLDEFAERLARVRQSIQEAEEKNKEFPQSRDLLNHSIAFNLGIDRELTDFNKGLLRSILKHGILGSRKFQVEQFGESRFTTSGGLVMGKDFVEIVENGQKKRLSPAEYADWMVHNGGGSSRKGFEEEQDQLFFTENRTEKFDRWDPYYRAYSVSFVFSKASLFSQSQFGMGQGMQLYDKDYDDFNPDSPGFHVDLTKEPMLIVVEEGARENFLRFIKEEVTISPLWQNQDVDSWIAENVIFSPPGSYANDTEQYREFYHRLEDKFFQRYPNLNVPAGKFMPTGNKGNNGNLYLSVYQ